MVATLMQWKDVCVAQGCAEQWSVYDRMASLFRPMAAHMAALFDKGRCLL